jgi:4-amino-4-deoxy-L-arabinose transferase-like glycosyltransferase
MFRLLRKGQEKWSAVATLGIILIFAGLLRMHNIEDRTLDHPEVYAPGIDLPWGLTNPNPRFTLWQTLAGSIAGEPHPPAYYVMMLGWTKWFGSSIFSLRSPSLLLGIASVLLIYLLASHTEDRTTGLLAAAMLAANGLHLYWSQNARMYSMACFLALLSTLILVLIVKNAASQRTCRVLYVVFTLAGLATHVYFWTIFATQAVWIVVRSLRYHRSIPGLLRLQIFTFIAASPLVAIAVYQSGAATRPRTLAPLEGVVRFMQFGSLFEIDPLAISTVSLNSVAAILALLTTVLLLASGVLSKRKHPPADLQVKEPDVKAYETPPFFATVAVGVLMALGVLAFAYIAGTILPHRSTRPVIAASLLPIAVVFTNFWLGKHWTRLSEWGMTLAQRVVLSTSVRSLNFFLAILPVSIIALVSLFNPMFIQRGTLLFVPYLLIVLSANLVNLIRGDKRWLLLVLILVFIHAFSVLQFNSKPSNPDYKSLAKQWVPRIQDSDLIFVHGRGLRDDWRVAPIFYYLNGARFHFVGKDFVNEINRHPRSRVWVLSFPAVPTEKSITNALTAYRAQERVDALNISAELYVFHNRS